MASISHVYRELALFQLRRLEEICIDKGKEPPQLLMQWIAYRISEREKSPAAFNRREHALFLKECRKSETQDLFESFNSKSSIMVE